MSLLVPPPQVPKVTPVEAVQIRFEQTGLRAVDKREQGPQFPEDSYPPALPNSWNSSLIFRIGMSSMRS